MPAPTNPQASKIAAQMKRGSMPTTRRREIHGSDPSKHYRWVHKDKVEQRRDDYNYEIVRKEGTTIKNKESLEGAIMSGSDVLMSCPREEWEARETYRREEAKRFKDGPREGFKTLAASIKTPSGDSVQTFDKTTTRYGSMAQELGQE